MRGYQDTTVKDIAAAAGITERTFFRYFPSREDLVFAETLDFDPLLRRGILRRPADEPPRALSGLARRTHVLTDFEDGITAALTLRFAALDPEGPYRRRVLRGLGPGPVLRGRRTRRPAHPHAERGRNLRTG
ncbi:helix-turn-helix domain-containing protein [Streptomyces lasalocidi]